MRDSPVWVSLRWFRFLGARGLDLIKRRIGCASGRSFVGILVVWAPLVVLLLISDLGVVLLRRDLRPREIWIGQVGTRPASAEPRQLSDLDRREIDASVHDSIQYHPYWRAGA